MMSTRRSGRRKSRGPFSGGRRGKSLIIYGAIIFVIGLVITIGTYSAASSGGGTYIISWGPMAAGLIAMIRGAVHLVADRRAMGLPGMAPGAGYGAPIPGAGQQGFGGQGFGAPGYAAPGYGAPGFAGSGPGIAPSPQGAPGFTPGPGFTPQAGPGTPAPGWFADPQDPTTLRWWDGQAWTSHTQPTAYTHPAGQAQPAGPGYAAGPGN